jgi:hypothetical protein
MTTAQKLDRTATPSPNAAGVYENCSAAAWRSLRVAWVCRASLFSVLLGAFLFWQSQTRDLFLDFSGIGAQDLWEHPADDFWRPLRDGLGFALLVTIFWALPVHSVARLAVSDDAWLRSPYGPANKLADLAAAKRSFLPAAIGWPHGLAIACFVIPILSAVYAWVELPIDHTLPLAVRARTEIIFDLIFLATFAAFFSIYMLARRRWFNLIHPASRHVPRTASIGDGDPDEELAQTIDRWISNVLFVFLLLLLGLPDLLLPYFPRLCMVPLLLGVWVPVLGWLARRSHVAHAPFILIAVLCVGILDYVIGDNHTVDVGATRIENVEGKPTFDHQVDLAEAVKSWRAANQCGDGSPETCPSPIIVMTTGGASRSSFFVGSVLGLLLDATCPQDIDPTTHVKSWQQAQPACAEEPMFAKRVFALSGVSGGSVGVAIFQKALSDGWDKAGFAPPCQHNPSATSLLSFAEKQPRTWRNCLQAVLAEDFLSPVIAGLGFRDVLAFLGGLFPRQWPDRGHRLEEAMVAAYAKFTDPAGAASAGAGLNAGFLEAARSIDGKFWRPALLLNSTSSESGRRLVFSTLRAVSGETLDDSSPGRTVHWLADAYDFHETIDGDKGSRWDISLAAAMHNSARFPFISPAGTLYLPAPAPPDRERPAAKAVLSADRYHSPRAEAPLLSVYRPRVGPIFGRLVDGGYFDNYGAATAGDLLLALREFGLRPFAMVITNDPIPAPAPNAAPTDWIAEAPRNPDSVARLPASFVSAPLDAVMSTSSAHGELSLADVRRVLEAANATQDAANQDCVTIGARDAQGFEPCFANIAVYAPPDTGIAAKVKAISMSWWLSKPVQEFLDEQIERKPDTQPASPDEQRLVTPGQIANAAALRKICGVLWPVKPDAAACVDNIDRLTNHLMNP